MSFPVLHARSLYETRSPYRSRTRTQQTSMDSWKQRFRKNLRCRIFISRSLQEAERQRLVGMGRKLETTQSRAFKRLRYASDEESRSPTFKRVMRPTGIQRGCEIRRWQDNQPVLSHRDIAILYRRMLCAGYHWDRATKSSPLPTVPSSTNFGILARE